MGACYGLCPKTFAVVDQKWFCKGAGTSLLPQGFLNIVKSRIEEQAFYQCYVTKFLFIRY